MLHDDHGKVIGAACGRCGEATLTATLDDFYARGRESEEDEEKPTAEELAQRCCVCQRCGATTERAGAQYCSFCAWLFRFANAWRNLGSAIKLGVTNPLVWEIVADQLDYGIYMHRLGVFLQRSPFYADAKSHCEGCGKPLTHAMRAVLDGHARCDDCLVFGAASRIAVTGT